MSAPDVAEGNAVAALARKVELKNVRMVELSAKVTGVTPTSIEAVDAALDIEVSVQRLPEGFVADARLELHAREKQEDGPEFMALSCRVGAIYRVAGELPSEATLQAFARTNGLIHLWPYLRTYVQQACAQLAAPVIILPPFRVMASEQWAEAEPKA
jgi:preprotein translocase subunit SecB